MITYTPTEDRILEDRVNVTLKQWLTYCPPAPHEHLSTTANDQGEVHLHGLVGCNYPLADVIALIRGVPGVRFVFNDVTLVYTGCSVAL
jgi:hypothetical protein